MQVDDDTWARLREAYETTSEPLKPLAARHGISVQRLVARARREGWSARAKTSAGTKNVTARTPKKEEAGLPSRRTQRSVIARLFRAISLKLEHMEKRMASGEARSAQDEERESRALATLINNFEKVTEAVTELDKERDAPRTARSAGADAERMRREIADRLERLGCLGPAGKGPGGARS